MPAQSNVTQTFHSVRSSLRELGASRSGQIPSLDGLRTLAIMSVIAAHSKYDFVAAGGVAKPAPFFSAVGCGWIGVDLFFVLSGFLIGKILLEEFCHRHTIQILPFLFRRGCRIWPLYYFVCLVALLGMWKVNRLPSWGILVPDVLLLTNYFGEHLAFGSWSLSVEEQFYVIVPSMLLLFKEKLGKSPFWTPTLFSALFLFAPLFRVLQWMWTMSIPLDPHDIEVRVIHNSILTHYDGLVMGLFLASILVYLKPMAVIRMRLGSLLGGLLFLTSALVLVSRTYFLFSFLATLFGSLAWHCLSQPRSVLTRALSWSGFQIISRLSYGMYLWYRFPLWRFAHMILEMAPTAHPLVQYLAIFSLTSLFAIACSVVTYACIEAPFLRLRSMFHLHAGSHPPKMIPLYSTSLFTEQNASKAVMSIPVE